MGNIIQTQGKKTRDSGIELLRIILMLQVIFLHVCTYGGYNKTAIEIGGSVEFIHKLIWLCCRCPVYVYIVIFGYFSVTSNKTLDSIKGKILKMYLPMYFYSVAIPFVGELFGLWTLTDVNKQRAFFPLTSKIWYFMTLYMLVLVLSPFINRCLTKLSRREYTQLIVILFLIFSIWTLFAGLPETKSVIRLDKVISETSGGKSLYGFIYMYILGGYLRLHVKPHGGPKARYLIVYFALALINLALWYFVDGYGKVVSYNSNPFSVIQGICLVLFFRELHFKSRAINHIAGLNLGVYMIHEQYLARNLIWDKFDFHPKWIYHSHIKYLAKIAIACVVVFVICALIEQIRVYLFAGVKFTYQKISRRFKTTNANE